MQEKSVENYSFAERLKKLRVIKQLKWVEVASLLDLSEAMIYKIIKGDTGMSPKSAFRLEKLEKESGIETPTQKLQKLSVIAEDHVDRMPIPDDAKNNEFGEIFIELSRMVGSGMGTSEIVRKLKKIKPSTAKLDPMVEVALGHSMTAKKLAQESGQSGKVASPSGNKPAPGRGASGDRK